ncbi:MAG: N-acetylmuramoyl-L-alanine amidase [Candidatus Omnitrophica bacterium]|nr:N-acetylmuramoyl-L-alanine amidase [Candidatus Omnitrophota bacterium]
MKSKIISIILTLNLLPNAYGFTIKGTDKTLDVPSYNIRGTEYLPLTLVCDAYGINWRWDSASRIVELNKSDASVRLRVGEYKVVANGVISIEEKPPLLNKGAVCIPSDFLRIINKIFLSGPTPPLFLEAQKELFPTVPSFYKIKKVVLDAGHGGYDPGAIGRDGIKEKYIALDITKKIKDLLEEKGIEVILTRRDDTFIPLWRRTDIANSIDADLFISIHANASRTRRLKGFEVYYLSETIDDDARAVAASENSIIRFDNESGYRYTDTLDTILWDIELTEARRNSILLANCIVSEVDVGKKSTKNARFYVLKGAKMPAVLVEVGYITNIDECSKLGWMEYRAKIAQQIANGILEYKKRFENSDGFTN